MNNFATQAGYTERRPSRGEPLLHAVSVEAQLSGLPKPDAECGRLVLELVGPWDGAEGRLCDRCFRITTQLELRSAA